LIRRFPLRSLLVLILLSAGTIAQGDFSDWVEQVVPEAIQANPAGICAGQIGNLPEITVTPTTQGHQLVRGSIPFPPGTFTEGLSITASCKDSSTVADVRVLTRHPGMPVSARRALITFPYHFSDTAPHTFTLALTEAKSPDSLLTETTITNEGVLLLTTQGEVFISGYEITFSNAAGTLWSASLIAPELAAASAPHLDIVEQGAHYLWVRLLVPDDSWPRIMELQMDSVGGVAVRAHLQRLLPGNDIAPDLGWEIAGLNVQDIARHAFSEENSESFSIAADDVLIRFPRAHKEKRGYAEVADGNIRFLRCEASEGVAFQETAWRSSVFSIDPATLPERTPLLTYDLDMVVPPTVYDSLYECGLPPDLAYTPLLNTLITFTHTAVTRATAVGDDFGNVTGHMQGREHGSVYGMNRLNHCPPIFMEGWRSGNKHLLETASLWCENMHDLSVWWGREKGYGGTRYNNAAAQGEKEHENDPNFMWRTNWSSHFCTKGFDSFFLAYEETGDPRMLAALNAQVAYAKEHIHTNTGEGRNIGDVADFMALYRYTKMPEYLDEALRLYRELREGLGEELLFSQGGKPLVDDVPFIDDDAHGLKVEYGKPYIMGYGLSGLPALFAVCPEENLLKETIRAVANFQAGAQDPLGGWRYPHPRSSWMIIEQGVEHSAQLARAAKVLYRHGENITPYFDAIERSLQARIQGYRHTGTILSGLGGWERAAGILESQSIYDLYPKPEDRNPARDYAEGAVSCGSSSPEGLVHFFDALNFYLQHRPAERLLHANPILDQVLARVPKAVAEQPVTSDQPALQIMEYGMKAGLPVFSEARISRMDYPLAYSNAGLSFEVWRKQAREAYTASLQTPPPRTSFSPEILEVEKREGYEARKLAFNISADERVAAYLLVPDGTGPFPAILALHDHGAHFTIGKEKVVRPFAHEQEKLEDAQAWTGKYYGGNFIGDELAARGYVVFATDALFWGDRGRAEGAAYEAQQELGANLLQLGQSWAGVITWDDIRSAEFLQGLSEVLPEKIGCIGLSMGAHRTWNLCVATDIVKAGAAICWLGDTPTLMEAGNNQTRGQSAFSMIHPGLRNLLDYPHVASIACPKPMLFFNGSEDTLFPVKGVEASYAILQNVYESQGVEECLYTRIWPVPHVFNEDMQTEAFAFLNKYLQDKE
jgi:dienelactone hydrolase